MWDCVVPSPSRSLSLRGSTRHAIGSGWTQRARRAQFRFFRALMHVAREPPQRSRLGGQPRPIEMIGAPSRQPAVDRLVPPCGWDDGVVGLLQVDSNSTTLMSGTFKVERRIHRKLRPHPDGERARCLPGDQTGLASLESLSVGAARRPWPTLIDRPARGAARPNGGQQCLMCRRACIPFVPAAQCISHPPSTLKAAPVMFAARSEARKAAISPMSFGVWKRPSGMRLLNHAQVSSSV
jgi:hypothetical protein